MQILFSTLALAAAINAVKLSESTTTSVTSLEPKTTNLTTEPKAPSFPLLFKVIDWPQFITILEESS